MLSKAVFQKVRSLQRCIIQHHCSQEKLDIQS